MLLEENIKIMDLGINIETHVTSSKYDKKINKYGVKCSCKKVIPLKKVMVG